MTVYSSGLTDSKDVVLLHVPHSSYFNPFTYGYHVTSHEIEDAELSIDHATDKIFPVEEFNSIVFPVSRLACDVERFKQDDPMEEKGRGVVYSRTAKGEKVFRSSDEIRLAHILYDYHHELFTCKTEKILENKGSVIIIDCHSFCNDPLPFEDDKSDDRPDICIGTCEFHTPKWLRDYAIGFFKEEGFSVKENSPYSGTIVPLKFYKKDSRVHSIMIEVNKKLYLNKAGAVERLQGIMKKFFTF